MLNFFIDKNNHGKRLDVFLRENTENLSAQKLKKSLHLFSCKVNGKFERFASYRVQLGDKVVFNEGLGLEKKLTLEDSHILYEDDDFFIINKPAQLICDEFHMKRFLGKEYFLAHRLDKQTTGVLVLAKNLLSLEYICQLFKNRKVEKSYVCIAEGKIEKKSFQVKSCLKKAVSFDGGGFWKSQPKGLSSLTDFELLDCCSNASLLNCYPFTGRTHQIRVHLSELGYPVLGDYLYGAKRSSKYVKRFMLHSLSLKFIHPKTKKQLSVIVDPPCDFKHALKEYNLSL